MKTKLNRLSAWKRAVFILIGTGLSSAVLGMDTETRAKVLIPFTQEINRAEASVPLNAGSGTTYEQTARPIRLSIPAIHVDAVIESVGLSWRNDGTMAVPSNFKNVGWYKWGPNPGSPGNAVIGGHLDGKNVPKAVFYNLRKLVPGDIVTITDEKNNLIYFQVKETKIYDYNASTTNIFLGDASHSRLNLITCAGAWDVEKKLYQKRIVVFTERIKVSSK